MRGGATGRRLESSHPPLFTLHSSLILEFGWVKVVVRRAGGFGAFVDGGGDLVVEHARDVAGGEDTGHVRLLGVVGRDEAGRVERDAELRGKLRLRRGALDAEELVELDAASAFSPELA